MSLASAYLLPSILLFQPPKHRKRQGRKSKRQLVADIGTLFPNQFSDWTSIPGDLHAKSSTKKAETKGTDCTPAERQQVLFAPSVEVIPRPSPTSKYEVLFSNDHDMHHRPVSYDAQKCLESCFWEEFCGAATDNDCSYEADGHQYDSGDSQSPWTKVLGMHSERIVVWDVVLWKVSGR